MILYKFTHMSLLKNVGQLKKRKKSQTTKKIKAIT